MSLIQPWNPCLWDCIKLMQTDFSKVIETCPLLVPLLKHCRGILFILHLLIGTAIWQFSQNEWKIIKKDILLNTDNVWLYIWECLAVLLRVMASYTMWQCPPVPQLPVQTGVGLQPSAVLCSSAAGLRSLQVGCVGRVRTHALAGESWRAPLSLLRFSF